MFDKEGPTFSELARQALSSTTRGYDMLAPKFEHTPFRTPDEILEALEEVVGPPGSIDRALDLCCGTGAAMAILRPLCAEYVTGIDRSQGMLDEAETHLQDAPGDAEIRLEQGDVLDMDYSEEFDVVVTFGALGHILPEDQDQFVRGAFEALRPGGRFIFATAPMPSVWSPRWWISRSFNAAMHVRNALIEPPFIMFYLIFTLERAREVLERNGFEIEVLSPYEGTRFSVMRLVVATRPADSKS